MSTVLLTGATGFLGQALLPRLAERAEVVAVHRRDATPPQHDGIRWVAQDLTDPLGPEIPDRLDAVIHLAQSLLYRDFPGSAADIFEVNTAATVRLLDHCRRAGGSRFVLASTGAVYRPGSAPLTEDQRPDPPTFYAQTKLMAEAAAESYREVFDVAVLRPFFLYGPGQQPDRFVPGLVRRIREGVPVRLAGRDGVHLNPMFVDDAVASVLAALDLDGSGTFNLAGPETVSIRRTAELIGERIGQEPTFEQSEPESDMVGSLERLAARLGAPRTPMREGIRMVVDGA